MLLAADTEAVRVPQIDGPWPFCFVGEVEGRFRPSLGADAHAVFGRIQLGKAAGSMKRCVI